MAAQKLAEIRITRVSNGYIISTEAAPGSQGYETIPYGMQELKAIAKTPAQVIAQVKGMVDQLVANGDADEAAGDSD